MDHSIATIKGPSIRVYIKRLDDYGLRSQRLHYVSRSFAADHAFNIDTHVKGFPDAVPPQKPISTRYCNR
jgi:hypothetical protein